MVSVLALHWKSIDQWIPRLFVWGSAFLLVGAVNSGLAFPSNGYAFSDWLGLVLLTPAALLVVCVFVDIAILEVSPLNDAVIGTGLALATLTVGVTVRTLELLTDRTSLDRDVTPR